MKKVLWMTGLAMLLTACDKNKSDTGTTTGGGTSTTTTNSATSTNK